MTRILWVHNFPPHVEAGGVFMHLLHRQLRATGADVDLLYTGSLRGPGRMALAASLVRRTARHYDLVHAQYGSACGLIGSLASTPCVLSLRGTDLWGCDTGGPWYRLHGLLCRRFTRAALARCRSVVVMSHRMRAELIAWHGYAPDRIEVVPDGVDLTQFQPLDRDEARRRLGLGHDRAPWVLFSTALGTGNPIKRPDLAVAAMDHLKRWIPDAELKLLTGQPHERVPLWVNACDAVLLTSTREGWPNIIKESLACGVPFVSTDVSDLHAIADQEPNCTVAEADPAALALGLRRALESGRTPALRRHVESMSLDTVAARLRQFYRRLAGSDLGDAKAA